MGLQQTPWADPLLFSTVISASLAVFSVAYLVLIRRHRSVLAFFVLLLGVSVWTLGYSFRFATDDVASKELWHAVYLAGQAIVPTAWFLFAAEYSGYDHWLNRRTLAGLFLVPVLTIALVATNGHHGAVWTLVDGGLTSAPTGSYRVLDFSHAWWYPVHVAYAYAVGLAGVVVFFQLILRSRRLYRGQAIALLVGALVPFLANVVDATGVSPAVVNTVPMAFTISGLAFSVAIFRYQLLDVLPVARNSVIETMRDGYVVVDPDGRVVDINPAAADIYGLDEQLAIGAPAERVLTPGADLLERAAGDSIQDELVIEDGDRKRYVEVKISCPEQGSASRLVVLRNVTDRRRIEKRYQALIENSSDIIQVIERDGTLRYVSPSIENVLGYEPDSLIGTDVFEYVHPDDRGHLRSEFETVLSEPDSTVRFEYRTEPTDGSHRVLEGAARNLLDNRFVGGVVVNSRDVTARNEREHELERTNERLEEFASVVSHDLRNPLNVAEGHLQLIDEPSEPESIATVQKELQRMRDIIDDVLAMARQGETVTDPDRIQLETAARRAWGNVDTPDATIRVPSDGVVIAEESRLLRLLENLFRNAVEHASPSVTVTVGKSQTGFFVSDDGPGIPPDDRATVFDSGYTTARNGTGFGLSVVQQIAKAHGWDVSVSESDDDGARFDVEDVDSIAHDSDTSAAHS
jgi:PAS domain S-box-containing protein